MTEFGGKRQVVVGVGASAVLGSALTLMPVPDSSDPTPRSRGAAAALLRGPATAVAGLGRPFAAAGDELTLVGGVGRDGFSWRRREAARARRDFTVNAIAARLPSLEIVDPFGGVRDLKARVLRTPGSPEDSFSDDALRMLRAARFAAQLGFTVVPEVQAAMTAMAGRLSAVSAERIGAELTKLICSPGPGGA